MAETGKKSAGIHSGHRERVRTRFRQEGLAAFSEHEVLELLLTYAIPQRDVNPLAHDLITQFGSLAGVLEAQEKELLRVSGVGAKAASLLTLIPQLLGRYQTSRMGARPLITNVAQAKEYCDALFFGAQEERVYMICMDQAGHVLHPALVRKGTLDAVPLYAREIVEIALRHNPYAVLITHNHPSGFAFPSQADYDVTKMIISALTVISVRVVDHLIVSPYDAYSMTQHSEMGDNCLSDDFSYMTRSASVPGKRGSLRADAGDDWISLTVDKLSGGGAR